MLDSICNFGNFGMVKIHVQNSDYSMNGMQFPDMVHAFKPNPKNHQQEGWRIMDFLSYHPESLHMVSVHTVLPNVDIGAQYNVFWGLDAPWTSSHTTSRACTC